MTKKKDLLGEKFGRLVVMSPGGKLNGKTAWLCRCSCGSEKIIRTNSLMSGTVSCGCIRKERPGRLRHGESIPPKTKEWCTWQRMLRRCDFPKGPRYHRYGGRGIQVCDQWKNSYEDFLKDVGRAPSSRHSLDRYPNPDGDYEPGNVRCATSKEQQANKSRL